MRAAVFRGIESAAMAGRIPAEREEPRAPDGHTLLEHPPAEGVEAAPEAADAVSIVGGCAVDFSGETT